MKVFEVMAAGIALDDIGPDDRVLWVSAESREQAAAVVRDTGAVVGAEVPCTAFVLANVDYELPKQALALHVDAQWLKKAGGN